MGRFLLAIDQGTTGSTAVALSDEGAVLGSCGYEFPQHYPKPGWVEHELDEIWASVEKAVSGLFEQTGLDPAECAGIGITNQRETTALWDRKSGAALGRAIVWQDRRTAPICRALETRGLGPLFRERTGLVIDPYFSGTKIAWRLEQEPELRKRAEAGEVAFGTIDSYLLYRLTGGDVHATDVTNASRTLLFDIRDQRFCPELAEALGVPMAMLPEARGCSEELGRTKGLGFLPDGIPIAGMAGDQHAALFGQTCFAEGEGKCTYGTGAFFLVNTGARPVRSGHGLLTTVAWRIGDTMEYALEGSAFIAGAAVQWLRDGLGLIEKASDIEALAAEVEDSGEVAFVPALAGLGAPYWDPEARGLICGISRGTTRAHIARATLEGISFQVADLARSMQADMGGELTKLKVDGGACQNDLLMQFQSDVLGVEVQRPACVETTALGAAYLAGLAVGVFADRAAIAEVHRIDSTFKPTMSPDQRAEHLLRWRRAVARARSEQQS